MFNTLIHKLTKKTPKLIFIVCAPRTGSTLLLRMLNCHSQLAAPCEITLPYYFLQDVDEAAKAMAFDKYERICHYYEVNPPENLQLQTTLFKKILAKEQKSILVIKHPRHALFFSELVRDFADARFIHLVKDARAVAMSTMFRHQPKQGLNKWLAYNQAILKAVKRSKNIRYYSLRYEDLLAQPILTLTALLNFVGCQFEENILDYNACFHADDVMQLWGGKAPKESHLHQVLRTGQVNSDLVSARYQFSEDVLALYEAMPELKALNQYFGYG